VKVTNNIFEMRKREENTQNVKHSVWQRISTIIYIFFLLSLMKKRNTEAQIQLQRQYQ